ncbi:MAG: hypothetical protein AAB300_02490 [Nitrospirota bacterium]
MEGNNRKKRKREIAGVIAFIQVTTLCASIVFAGEPQKGTAGRPKGGSVKQERTLEKKKINIDRQLQMNAAI